LQKSTQTNLAEIKQSLALDHNLRDILIGNESSLMKLKTDYGISNTKILILWKITEISELIGAEFTEIQMEFLVDNILQNYWGYTLSDFNIILNMLVNRKSFEKPTVRTIISTIDEYSYIRNETSVAIHAQKNSEYKAEYITTGRMQEIYDAMKREAKKPQETLLEKRTDNLKTNREKIEELKKQYPDEKWDKFNM